MRDKGVRGEVEVPPPSGEIGRGVWGTGGCRVRLFLIVYDFPLFLLVSLLPVLAEGPPTGPRGLAMV